MKTVGEAVAVALALSMIGAVASVWFIVDKIGRRRRISWRSAGRSAREISERLANDDFLPSLVLGIGRGGAIFGSMISGCLGHRPLIVVDRKYTWNEGRRTEDLVLRMHLPNEMLSRVLLVAGEAHTGNTMRLFYDYFQELHPGEIRRAVFYLQDGSTEKIDYCGTRGRLDRRMPWMFSKRYRRGSRSEQEARGLEATDTSRGS